MDEKNEDSPEEIHQDKSAIKDKVEGMSYKQQNPKTGKEEIYKVSYSQVLQKKIDDHLEEVGTELKKSNRLKKYLIGIAVIILILTVFVLTGTGIVGYIARRAVCPI